MALLAFEVFVKTLSHSLPVPLSRGRKASSVLDVYCFEPGMQSKLSLLHLWTTVHVRRLKVMNMNLESLFLNSLLLIANSLSFAVDYLVSPSLGQIFTYLWSCLQQWYQKTCCSSIVITFSAIIVCSKSWWKWKTLVRFETLFLADQHQDFCQKSFKINCINSFSVLWLVDYKSLVAFLMQMEFETLDASGHYDFYQSDNESAVYELRTQGSTQPSAVLSKKGILSMHVPPFRRTCTGIDTVEAYRLKLDITGMLDMS